MIRILVYKGIRCYLRQAPSQDGAVHRVSKNMRLCCLLQGWATDSRRIVLLDDELDEALSTDR